MTKQIFTVLTAVILGVGLSALALGQTQPTTITTTTQTPTTVTKTVQHPDGTYTIIEYPVGKETTVTLNPVTITGATGTATILRDDDGTRIKVNLTGIPKDVTQLNLYAVDPGGATTLLGPIAVSDGLGTFTATTPLNKFMLVASPESSLTAYEPNSKVFLGALCPKALRWFHLQAVANATVLV